MFRCSRKSVGLGLIFLLIFSSFAAFLNAADNRFVTGQAAVAVVGQKDFSSNVPGTAADQLGALSGLVVAGERLIVSDGGLPFSAPSNHRVLIFPNVSQLTAGAAASVVIGQPDFAGNTAGLSEKALNRPVGVSTDGQRLAVADAGNNRVVIFNQIPAANGAAADVVVGQADFKTSLADTSDSRLRGPDGVFIDGQHLLIADTLNSRVLIFNAVPSSNGAKANVVLGQADFNSHADQPASATALRNPTAVFFDGVRLIVTDLGHNRVLIYNRIPASNNAPADVVVGQPDFTSEAAGTGPASLNFPRFAVSDGIRLFIADAGNNRVLVFNQIPTSNGAAADAVLGQKDFHTANDPDAIDPERLTAGILGLPVALALADSSVLVADSDHRRVLRFAPGVPVSEPGAVVNAASFGGNGVPRVTNVNVEASTDGSLPAGTYFLKVTAEGGILFESTPSEEVAVTVPNNSKLVVTFDEAAGATAYRVYLGGSPGGQNRYFTTATPESGKPIERRVEISSLAAQNAGGPRLEITPGEIAVLFGTGLAPQEAMATALPLPQELAGTTLLINGLAAPLFYVSPTQINFQVPWEIAGSSGSLVVQRRSPSGDLTVSTAITVPISNLTPGLFTVAGDGVGRLLAFHADFSPVDDDDPVTAGEIIIFFGTGVQQLKSAPPPTGEASPEPVEVDTTHSVSIQGRDAPVQYAGLAPGLVGVLQFNVKVADDLEQNGERADVKVFVGSIPANLTQVPIKDIVTATIEVTRDGHITWSTTPPTNARVYVSTDGGPETLYGEGASGDAQLGFIVPGHVFVFTLKKFVGGVEGRVLATFTLDTR